MMTADNKNGGIRTVFDLLKATFKDWSEDKAARLAAALSYYTIFSIAPLLIVVIAVAGLIFGQAAVQGQIVGQIQGLVGRQGATLIQTMIASASKPQTGIVATIIGVVTLLLGASGVFGQLQDALNTIWEVAPAPGRKIWQVLRDRLLTFGMVLGIGFVLLVSLVISAAISALNGALSNVVPVGIPVVLWQVVNQVVSFLVITLLFALIFKYLPDVRIGWRNVWVGAAFTGLLFTIGKFLIGLYLGRTSAGSAYGAAGSLVVVLLWIYYSAQILFMGAEFTQAYTRYRGEQAEPIRGTVPLSDEARMHQGMPKTSDRPPRHQAGKDAQQAEKDTARQPAAGDRGRRPQRVSGQAPARGRFSGLPAAAAGAVLLTLMAVARVGRKP